LGAPIVAGALLLGGCVGLALVDPTHGPTICPFKLATGLDCPGCGGTRAAHELLTGHLGRALDYNALAVVALPFIAWALFVVIVAALGGPKLPQISLSKRWTYVGVAVILVFWVVRNLPIAPFNWLGTRVA
jgi:hypothetical protein